LVNDLLDLAQLRAGKFKLTNERFDLQDLLINVMKLMTLQSKIKNLYLQLVVDPANIKTQMVSDPKRIQQIIMNLISNSIKFTNQGGVTLELKRGPDNNAVITLRDTGAGIEK
jgi:signal transduction histidine kinase